MTAAGKTSQQVSKQALTKQQTAIIHSSGDLRINAVAGSGKTTTIIEYAASRAGNARILYLAFNKSVKLEAARKFEAYGLYNTKVETAHSLAYKHIVFKHNYKIKAQGYKNNEICQVLGIQGNGEKHAEFVVANHIAKFAAYFCNSDKAKVQDLNYLDTIVDVNARAFVNSYYKFIEDGTRLFLARMDRGEIEITHDFYLKKFQLSNPVLPYDYILFDEAQDASAAMLDVFKKQKATKIIVGDTHQQIYGWRHAVNSLDKADFNTLHLSTSFRFTQDIANLATNILSWKNHLFECNPVPISGKGDAKKETSKATIARTNLGLLLNAINYITDNKVKHIYFEGNISSYTYADDGTSLYDVLSLYNGNRDRIRDQLVGTMKDLEELEEYVEKTEDHQLATMIEIVREYGNEIHGILKSLKELQTTDEDRNKADMIFSTVHRAKGMEYDVVHLVNDFLSESKLKELKEKQKTDKTAIADNARLNEEINLLYVAVTRTKNKLHIPENLLPKDFPASPYIIKVKARETSFDYNSYFTEKAAKSKTTPVKKKTVSSPSKEKSYTVWNKREINKDAYKPWTDELDEELKMHYDNGTSIGKIAAHLGRTKGAVISRLKKLSYYLDE
jgi:F-box protein 18 (helicase)